MNRIRAWHSTKAEFETFAPFSHFGTRAQAEMRRTRGGRLIEVDLLIPTLKILKDDGDWNRARLQRLAKQGYDGVRYLNRFEGIPLEAFDRARAKYRDIDRLSDQNFRRALPEASESWIVFDPSYIKIISVITPDLLDK